MLAYVDRIQTQRVSTSLLRVSLKGWVGTDPYEIVVLADGKEVSRFQNNTNRPDVCAVLGEEEHDNQYGYEHTFTMKRFVNTLEVHVQYADQDLLILTKDLLLAKQEPIQHSTSENISHYLHNKFNEPNNAYEVDNRLREDYIYKYGYVSNRLYNPYDDEEYREWLSFQSYRKYDVTFKDITFIHLHSKSKIKGKYTNLYLDTLDVAKVKTNYICIIDNNVILHPQFYGYLSTIKGKDAIYFDHDHLDLQNNRYKPVFAPDYAPETLLGFNYVGNVLLVRKDLLLNIQTDSVYGIALELMHKGIYLSHIHKVIYSTTVDTPTLDIIQSFLTKHNYNYSELKDANPIFHPIEFHHSSLPLISIIIPTKDHKEDLHRCLTSLQKSTYTNYEIIIINNNSQDPNTLIYLQSLKDVKVVDMPIPFNYAKINNDAIRQYAKGEYIVYLNNDTEVISENWLEMMLGYCALDNVGTVGIQLLYEDGGIQHNGILMGRNDFSGEDGVAGSYFQNDNPVSKEDNYREHIANNVMASTAACLMVKRAAFDKVNGMEEDLAVAFNDVDFGLKMLKVGYRNVYLPFVFMYHLESKSRGAEDTPEKIQRFIQEVTYMQEHWHDEIHHDYYYNANYSLEQLFWLKDLKDTTWDANLDIR